MDKNTIAKMTDEIRTLSRFHPSDMRKYAPDATDMDLELSIWRAMQPLMKAKEDGAPVFKRDGEFYVRLDDAGKVRRAASFHRVSKKKLKRSLDVADSVDETKLEAAQKRVHSNLRNRIAREVVQIKVPEVNPADIKAPSRPKRNCQKDD